MFKFDLQMFAAEAVKGSKLVYLYRVLEDAAKEAGTVFAYVTENTLTESKDTETTVTKDGPINTPGESEIELESTSLLAVGDTMYAKMRKAMRENKVIEIWEANLAEPADTGENKFKGTYYQGYLTEFEKASSAEDYVEVSTTFKINGVGAEGDVTVTTEQQAIADYVFRDTTKTGA